MNVYDDVHAEAMADYHNERPEPDYRDMILDWADEPLFDHSEVPLHVYEAAEVSDVSHPCSTVTENTNPCEGATE